MLACGNAGRGSRLARKRGCSSLLKCRSHSILRLQIIGTLQVHRYVVALLHGMQRASYTHREFAPLPPPPKKDCIVRCRTLLVSAVADVGFRFFPVAAFFALPPVLCVLRRGLGTPLTGGNEVVKAVVESVSPLPPLTADSLAAVGSAYTLASAVLIAGAVGTRSPCRLATTGVPRFSVRCMVGGSKPRIGWGRERG